MGETEFARAQRLWMENCRLKRNYDQIQAECERKDKVIAELEESAHTYKREWENTCERLAYRNQQLHEKDAQLAELEKDRDAWVDIAGINQRELRAESELRQMDIKQCMRLDAQLAKYKAALEDAKSNMQFTVQTVDEILPKIWPEYQGPCYGDCEGPCGCDTPKLANELYAHRYHCLGGVVSIEDALAEGEPTPDKKDE